MFPTSVGMNQPASARLNPFQVFPTSVGMNLETFRFVLGVCRVPHKRGDEPAVPGVDWVQVRCSPQAWG